MAQDRKILQANPNDYKTHNNLGVALSEKGELEGAIQEYREALRLAPKDAEVHNNLGVALGKEGDRRGSRAEYETAVRLDPGFAEGWYDLGVSLEEAKNVEKAGKALRKAINLKPNWADPHLALANLLQTQANDVPVYALAEYLEVLRLKPGDSAASVGAGTLLDQEGCWKEAAKQFQNALVADPNQASLHAALGYSLHGTGDLQGSTKQYQMAARLDVGNRHFKNAAKKVSKELETQGSVTRISQSSEASVCNDLAGLATLLPSIEHRTGRIPGTTQPIYKVGGKVTVPVAVHEPDPPYTDQARRAHFQGTVVLSMVIDAAGKVRDVRLLQGVGMGLDDEAIRTVLTWRFMPATRNGVPVPVRVTVEIRFRLFGH